MDKEEEEAGARDHEEGLTGDIPGLRILSF